MSYLHVGDGKDLLPFSIHEETRADGSASKPLDSFLPIDKDLMQCGSHTLPEHLLSQQDLFGDGPLLPIVSIHFTFAEDPTKAIRDADRLLQIVQQLLREVLQRNECAWVDFTFQRNFGRARPYRCLSLPALFRGAHAYRRSTFTVDQRRELVSLLLRALDRPAENVDHLIVRVHLVVEEHRDVLLVVAIPKPRQNDAFLRRLDRLALLISQLIGRRLIRFRAQQSNDEVKENTKQSSSA